MEKQPNNEYRDELANKLREIRNSDLKKPELAKAKAQGYLEAESKTEEYEEAKDAHILYREEQEKKSEFREYQNELRGFFEKVDVRSEPISDEMQMMINQERANKNVNSLIVKLSNMAREKYGTGAVIGHEVWDLPKDDESFIAFRKKIENIVTEKQDYYFASDCVLNGPSPMSAFMLRMQYYKKTDEGGIKLMFGEYGGKGFCDDVPGEKIHILTYTGIEKPAYRQKSDNVDGVIMEKS